MGNRVTLADMSKKTGLSQSTISMILNKRFDVSFSEETIKTVQDAAKELGYIPVSRKQVPLFARKTILVVCPFVFHFYYSSVVQAVQSAAAQMRCNTLVYTTFRNPDEEERILKVMAESDIGGVLFAMMPQSRHLLKKISKKIPLVILADKEPGAAGDYVYLHNYQAGSLVAKHLIDLGHKHAVCISTALSSSLPARVFRFEGLKDTWKTLCPEGSLRLVSRVTNFAQERDNLFFERDLGRSITESVLESEGRICTAFVAINDMMAYGVLDALAFFGHKVPETYSVCGLDNDFPSDIVGVNLTTVEHFMAHNAEIAFYLLYQKMLAEDLGTETQKIITPELVVRGSTGKPRV
ncbi:MAG: LacI family DNA-binding transcriptional regulator [Desulfovibrio sp.]|nr:LacI family DNA-binding transcriptional regulator [Desulfovibrio sp.]